jgi:hypothetical protein
MLFNPASSGRLCAPPAGFVRPPQPTLVVKPPAGPAWLHEVKHDGYRLIALKEGARVKLWTQHCTNGVVTLPCREREVSVPQELSGRCDRGPPRGHRVSAKRTVRLG